MTIMVQKKFPVFTSLLFLVIAACATLYSLTSGIEIAFLLSGILLMVAAPALAIWFHRLFIWDAAELGPMHIPVAIFLSLAVSVGAGIFFSQGDQVFASFGAIKKVAVPAIFIIFLGTLCANARGVTVRPPFWWWLLATITTISLFFEMFVPRQDVDISAVAQGFALMGSILLVSLVAFKFPVMSERAKAWLFALLFGAAFASAVAGISVGVFVALQVPCATLLLVMAIQGAKHRFFALVAAAAIILTIFTKVSGNENVSSALVTQIVAGVGIVALALMKRKARLFFAVAGAVGGVVYLFRNGTVQLMMGNAGWEDDVTLVHRAYEAEQVYRTIGEHPLSVILGLGPGATVDLSSSPDVLTLAASGRNLFAVDDVHFLMVWVVLKFGILGVVWLVTVLFAIAKVAWRTLNNDAIPIYEIGLLLFVVTGFITALPAATHLFANPLPFLCLGLLEAQRSLSKKESAADPGPSKGLLGTAETTVYPARRLGGKPDREGCDRTATLEAVPSMKTTEEKTGMSDPTCTGVFV